MKESRSPVDWQWSGQAGDCQLGRAVTSRRQAAGSGRINTIRTVLQTMKCPFCGGKRFEDGTLAIYNSISYIVFNSEKRPFVTLGNSLRARVCLDCGRVDLFAPKKAFEKKKGSREKAVGSGEAVGGRQ